MHPGFLPSTGPACGAGSWLPRRLPMNQTRSAARKGQDAVRAAGAARWASLGRWARRELAVLIALVLAASAVWALRRARRRGPRGRDPRLRRADPARPAQRDRPRRSPRPGLARGVDARRHRARQHRRADLRHARGRRLPRPAAQGSCRAVRGARGGRGHAAQHAPQDGLRPAAPRPRAPRRGRLHRELPERPLDDGGGRLSDARRACSRGCSRAGGSSCTCWGSRSC